MDDVNRAIVSHENRFITVLSANIDIASFHWISKSYFFFAFPLN